MPHLAEDGAWLFYFEQDGPFKQQSKSVFARSAIITEQMEKRMAAKLTVSSTDVHAILTTLGGVMGDYMAQRRLMKLDGIASDVFCSTLGGDENSLP